VRNESSTGVCDVATTWLSRSCTSASKLWRLPRMLSRIVPDVCGTSGGGGGAFVAYRAEYSTS
jgi:hypothetical protein